MRRLTVVLLMGVGLAILIGACKDADDNWKHTDHTPPEGRGSLIMRNSSPERIGVKGFPVGPLSVDEEESSPYYFTLEYVDTQSDAVKDLPDYGYELIVYGLRGDWDPTTRLYTNTICIETGKVAILTVYAGYTTLENRDGTDVIPECEYEEEEEEEEDQLLVRVNGSWQLSIVPLGVTATMTLNHEEEFTEVKNGIRTQGCRLTGNIDNASGTGPTGSVSGSLVGYDIIYHAWPEDGPEYMFHGTVNAAGTSMTGTFSPANPDEDQWSAAR